MLNDFTREKFDIVVQAGQSNSEGCGMGIADDPFVNHGNVYYLTREFTIYPAEETVSGQMAVGNFSLVFCNGYIRAGKLAEGRKLLIIRAAVGGTGFVDRRWGLTDDLYLDMIELMKTALALNPENRLVAFLWHQGETDAMLNAGYKLHYNNLITMIKSIRETFKKPDLPFIAGDFVPQWKNNNPELCAPIVEAMSAACHDLRYARFVGSEGLMSNMEKTGLDNVIHFCRDSLNKLGERFLKAYCEICGA